MVGVFGTDTVTIKRPTLSSSGLKGGATSTIATGVKCRLEVGKFRRFDSADEYSDDFFDIRGFFKKGTDLKKDDIIEHSGGENYTVIDIKPQKTIHGTNHLEIAGVSRD